MIVPKIPKGFRDFLPGTMCLRQQVMDTMRSVFELYGFAPLDTPCIEYAETLEGKYGEEGEKLMYKFTDRGGREVALRYDLTIPLSRVMASHKDLIKPFKRYQIAPVWRADKPQKGRYREFYQCDADIVGTASPYADAELLLVSYTVLTRLGFTDFTMRINSRKILNALARSLSINTERHMTGFFRILDKLDKAGPDAVLRELVESKTVSPDSSDRLGKLLTEEIPEGGGGISHMADMVSGVEGADQAFDELSKIRTVLASHGIEDPHYTFDITLARGLDYYTGPVFETVMKKSGMGSISGGGRYDDLIGMFSKESQPATGISFGLERIIGIMEERRTGDEEQSQTRVLVALFSEDLMADCQKIAEKLRRENIASEVSFTAAKLKKQLSYAAGRNIPYVIIPGPEELEQGLVTVKCMKTGDQKRVPISDIDQNLFDRP